LRILLKIGVFPQPARYEHPVGEHLKYLAWAQGRPIACLAWSSAPRHLGSRDRYIGWEAEARRRNIRFIVYNMRFLILLWVRDAVGSDSCRRESALAGAAGINSSGSRGQCDAQRWPPPPN
jgi:hypothetical protein